MEEKKLGMVWYKILKYFFFGFLTIISIGSAVLTLFNLIKDFYADMIPAFLISVAEAFFMVIIYRHLKNYSTKAGTFIMWFFIASTVSWLMTLVVCILVSPEDIISNAINVAFGIAFVLINHIYFKNRKHIFTTKCNFWGKKIASAADETAEVSE